MNSSIAINLNISIKPVDGLAQMGATTPTGL